MNTEPDPTAEHDPAALVDPRAAHPPRLDADGMPLGAPSEEGGPSATPEKGPGLLWPVVISSAGFVLTVFEAVRVVQHVPDALHVRSMSGLLLAMALALGGFSLVRLLQLRAFAASRCALHPTRPDGPQFSVPWQLTDAHTVHAVWVIGVGSSVAFMGALGLWSLAGDRRTGIEPGWPLLLIGTVVILVARLVWTRTTALWEHAGEGLQGPHRLPGDFSDNSL